MASEVVDTIILSGEDSINFANNSEIADHFVAVPIVFFKSFCIHLHPLNIIFLLTFKLIRIIAPIIAIK